MCLFVAKLIRLSDWDHLSNKYVLLDQHALFLIGFIICAIFSNSNQIPNLLRTQMFHCNQVTVDSLLTLRLARYSVTSSSFGRWMSLSAETNSKRAPEAQVHHTLHQEDGLPDGADWPLPPLEVGGTRGGIQFWRLRYVSLKNTHEYTWDLHFSKDAITTTSLNVLGIRECQED